MLGAGLKAGIIMGIIVAVIAAIMGVVGISTNPIVGLFSCFLLLVILVLWFVSGMLAARFGPAALTTGAAAGGGAVAGAITQLIGGIVSVVMGAIMQLVAPVSSLIPPETIRQFADLGVSPRDFQTIMEFTTGPTGLLINCMCCVGAATAIAAGLGAIGGIVGKAVGGGKG
jgi:hypothetical protein